MLALSAKAVGLMREKGQWVDVTDNNKSARGGEALIPSPGLIFYNNNTTIHSGGIWQCHS